MVNNDELPNNNCSCVSQAQNGIDIESINTIQFTWQIEKKEKMKQYTVTTEIKTEKKRSFLPKTTGKNIEFLVPQEQDCGKMIIYS